MDYRYQVGEEIKTVNVERDGNNYHVRIADKTYSVGVNHADNNTTDFNINGKPHRAYTATQGDQRYVAFNADVAVFSKATTSQRRKHATSGDNQLTATMPGQVIKVLVNEGDSVTRGQPLVLLEAMKMEIRVNAPADGHVSKVLVSAGQIVERGQVLIDLSKSA
jgi:biotin carboxyl carrier protein